MRNLQVFKEVLTQYNFPTVIINCVYWPLHLVIQLLNCIHDSITFYLLMFALYLAFCFFVGGIFTLAFTAFKGYKIYNARHGGDEEEEEQEDPTDKEKTGNEVHPESGPDKKKQEVIIEEK